MATVTAIAGQPRPLGSPASDAVRDLLVDRLRVEGLDARVTTSVGANAFGGEATVGRVDNIVATLPGTDPTGAVVLAAHYDSVAAGPGAADDGAAVAAVLETVRVLRTQVPLRNDLVVLLTDGEENGLLGAQSFVRNDPLRDRPVVVLNWEARGVSGPSLMFQTSPGNARLVEQFAAAAPHPDGDSSLVEAYRFLPNDTDLSEFLDAGRPGMNFAFVEGAARYHTPSDDPAHLSAASLQHHGSSMLGLAAVLGGTDLAPFDPAVSGAEPVGDTTYFPFLGAFITYPGALVVPIAVGALLVVAAAVLVARRRRLLTLRRLLAGAASLLLPLLLAGLLGQGLWLTLVALRPAYGDGAGFLHRPLLLELATLTLAGLALVVWGLLLRRRIGALALGLGAALWLAALGVATAALVPGMSFLFALPALGLGAGALVAVAVRGAVRPIVLAVGAVPLVVLVLPFVLGLFDAGGCAGRRCPRSRPSCWGRRSRWSSRGCRCGGRPRWRRSSRPWRWRAPGWWSTAPTRSTRSAPTSPTCSTPTPGSRAGSAATSPRRRGRRVTFPRDRTSPARRCPGRVPTRFVPGRRRCWPCRPRPSPCSRVPTAPSR